MDTKRLLELAGIPITEGTLTASNKAFRGLDSAIDAAVKAVEDDKMVDEDAAKRVVAAHCKDYCENL